MQGMNNTLKNIFRLRTTIKTNGVLYAIKHLPFVGKHISDRIYGIRAIKIVAFIIGLIAEFFQRFFGKILLFFGLFFGSGAISSFRHMFQTGDNFALSEEALSAQGSIYLYAFVVISIALAIMYSIFACNMETEYCVFMLNMDAKKFVGSIFALDSIINAAAYALMGIPTALLAGVPWYYAILLPFSGIGFYASSVAIQMLTYSSKLSAGKTHDRKGNAVTAIGNNGLNVLLGFGIFLVGALVGPAYLMNGYPIQLPAVIVILSILAIIPALLVIRKYPYGLYRNALKAEREKMRGIKQNAQKAVKKASLATISETGSVDSNLTGYSFLNELFIKRHRKLLWGKIFKYVIGIAAVIVLMSIYLFYEWKKGMPLEESLIRKAFTFKLSAVPFLMYFLNRGAVISQVMFSNCDSSLLKFGFYKEPKAILTMFRLRLFSVVKLNLVPALMIAVYAVIVLKITGGEDYQFHYLFTFLSIILSMIFFSVHHLAIYYLLQPYTMEFKIKSSVYLIINAVIYMVCWSLFNNEVSAQIFAPVAAAFTVIYITVACILVYKLAPKTFRIK